MGRVHNLGSIVATLSSQTTDALDLTDILRAELVLAVSALDHYIHEIVRLGMIESYRGTRPRTSQFRSFQISLGSALDGLTLSGDTNETWIGDEIRSRNGFRSFQTPDNIASAVRLVSDVSLWNDVAQLMRATAREVRDQLLLIVDRRNKIAHEADMRPLYQDRSPIDPQWVDQSVAFLERVAEAIHEAIR